MPSGSFWTPALSARDEPLGLYVHWPFCRSKCPYCDFNSHVRKSIDEARWRAALVRELDHFAAIVGRRTLISIFFGGGTPSLMDPATVAAVIDRAVGHFDAAPDIEITLEANPTSVEAERFAGYRTAGVNRVSLGVQSLRDADLKALGRGHTAAEALAAVKLAQSLFPRVSFDLIHTRPQQTLEDWRTELRQALDLAAGHLSLYQLTIEEGTAYHQMEAEGRLLMPDDDTSAAFFEATQDMCAAAGMPAYEVSNHAAAGQESRHNLIYWRYQPYIGIGPGAHGRLPVGDTGRRATQQIRQPEEWLQAVETHGHGTAEMSEISALDQAQEALLVGLRLTEGVAWERVAPAVKETALQDFMEQGLLVRRDGRLWACGDGRLLLNRLIAELAP